MDIKQKLIEWRDETAKNEGVEFYRVLSNQTIDEIVEKVPKTKEDLVLIGGIKDKKSAKYGNDILSLVANTKINKTNNIKKIYTVSNYLDLLNTVLRSKPVKIIGEVSSIDVRSTYVFFSLKDKEDGSLLGGFMWKSNYDICGIDVKEGMEIIINGYAEIYKPSGRLSIRTSTVELVGEGELKKAYNKLKNKLEDEGLFKIERKKKIQDFPKRIGLITSETGAVIHDFLNNLGKHGYKIMFANSRVEGQIAVSSLLSAIEHFKSEDIDVLIIIRGGGSLESLQAFNNEKLVRAIAGFEKPVICGIGHDKDVPLASMVGDVSVSTPTAVTSILDSSWEKAIGDVDLLEKDLFYKYQKIIERIRYCIDNLSNGLNKGFNSVFKKFEDFKYELKKTLTNIGYNLKSTKKNIIIYSDLILKNFERWVRDINNNLDVANKQLKIFNPIRQLKLGYSIILSNGKIVKGIKQIKKDDSIDIQVSDGNIKANIIDVR